MFIPGILREGEFPHPKKLTISFPQMAAKLCALSGYFSRGNELQIYHRNILIADN